MRPGRGPVVSSPTGLFLRSDLASACLEIARESCPELDIEGCLRSLDDMAVGLRHRIRAVSRPATRIRLINEDFFGALGFRSSDARDCESLLTNLLLNEVLEHRVGHCLGLSLVYLSLCERLQGICKDRKLDAEDGVSWLDQQLAERGIKVVRGGKGQRSTTVGEEDRWAEALYFCGLTKRISLEDQKRLVALAPEALQAPPAQACAPRQSAAADDSRPPAAHRTTHHP